LKRYRIRYVYGYTSALYELALHMIEAGRRDVEMSVVLTNAEPVFDYQRRAIQEAFHCPLIETYGMAEMAAGASACSRGAMHLWPEVACLEALAPPEAGAASELVSTGLLNPNMPLIRYRVGDRVRLGNEQQVCECGRGLPVLESIEGRSDDILYTSDGRRIGRLDPIFKAELPVKEAQIVQEALDLVRVRYVPDSGFTGASGLSIVQRLQARMGDVRVILEEVESLPRGANGKFRAVICNIVPGPRESGN
jgi:phenylacetate-coenzyme A ligase PaaK-like adenylate-forming protein